MNAGDHATPGALDGLTVLDFSRVLADPFATMMLGDLSRAPASYRSAPPPLGESGTVTW